MGAGWENDKHIIWKLEKKLVLQRVLLCDTWDTPQGSKTQVVYQQSHSKQDLKNNVALSPTFEKIWNTDLW